MKANLLRPSATLAVLALAACSGPRMIPETESRSPAPAPQPAQGSSALPASPTPKGWADFPATPGDWHWSNEGGRSTARFANGRVVLRCDPVQRTVRIERNESGVASRAPATLRIVTQTQTRAFNAVPQAGAYAVDVPARDPLLDAMAFSKGRFAIETTGLQTLYVPSWTEVSRVIEDCR
ncbi:hypothetical protein [Novosphingobium sp. 9U]|uniref:hypothetical protein n=1 Tax=Novosphingobium sp. 9U TaxID=2653158 RepID=UPI00135AD60F|nr:hypothetical protein [Novosphingobium sp. 9U]